MTIVKKVIDGILSLPIYIYVIYHSGTFPEKMKIAKVIPLHKAGDKHNFSNYGPFSLFSQFSKIIKHLFVARLNNFIENCNILMGSLYGFISTGLTSMAIWS